MKEWLLNVVMRSILAAVAIYFINTWMEGMGLQAEVGINAFTVLTSGFLGLPGLLALYGLGIYKGL